VEIDDSDPVTWDFTDEPPGTGDADTGPGEGQEASTIIGKLDQAVAEALTEEAGAIGCWRAWRFPGGDAPSATAKPVFVIEVESDVGIAGVTARMQQRLAAAGEASPQVEVYPRDFEPPAYQWLARDWGELIWAAAEDPAMQVASIFDEVDPQDGPRFSPGHPRLDAGEAVKVARYLREAEPVLVTSALMDDVVDTSRQYCVPLNFRTDGMWIWTEASAYYAQEHLLEPDPGLLTHIRSNHHTVPDVDGVAVHRALEVLQQPPEAEPVWTFGGSPDEEASEEIYGDDSAEEAFGRYGSDASLDDEVIEAAASQGESQDGREAHEGRDSSSRDVTAG
jgi:hypothetical protein